LKKRILIPFLFPTTRALIVECTYTNVKDLTPYYKHKGQKLAHLPLNFQLIDLHNQRGTQFKPKEIKRLVETYLAAVPQGCWPNWQIGNPDNARVASRIGAQNATLANVLNLMLGGTAVMYYGEEIGMEDLPGHLLTFQESRDEFGRKYGPEEFMKYTRDYARTPMQWNGSDR
jgi:alpha-glucosidase